MIAYINFDADKMAGVRNGFIQQSKIAASLGLPIDFMMISPNSTGAGDVGAVRYINAGIDCGKTMLNIKKALYVLDLIDKAVDLTRYDVVLIRYPGACLRCKSFFMKHPRKIVFVRHAKELHEYLSFLMRMPLNLVRIVIEKVFGPKILDRSLACVAVTDEILEYQVSRIKREMPGFVMSNGISNAEIRMTGRAPFDGKTLRMIFVSSNYSPWQGIERLLQGIENYAGGVRVSLDLVGIGRRFEALEIIKRINGAGLHRIECHEATHAERLDRMMGGATLGVATLALHKKGLRQACPLKTREYVSRGLPFIYAYDDPDIAETEDFALKMPASDSAIDIEKVIAFAVAVSNDETVSGRMRKYAEKHLDWGPKLARLAAFLKSISEDGIVRCAV